MEKTLVFLLCTFISQFSFAGQAVIADYDAARDGYLYPRVYLNYGKTFYCGADFSSRRSLQVEHVYPASWMKETVGCPSTYSQKKYRSNYGRFKIMEADLHNLYSGFKDTNQDRSAYTFGISGSDDLDKAHLYLRASGNCDFEVDADHGVVEPPKEVRGEIARAMLYMHHKYVVPIEYGLEAFRVQWNMDDTPSPGGYEVQRNNKIEVFQSPRNHFIDDLLLVDSLYFSESG